MRSVALATAMILATVAVAPFALSRVAHAAGTVTQTVSSVTDRNGLRFDLTSGLEFDDLRSVAEEDHVFIQPSDADPQTNTTWWDAAFEDLDPGIVFPGSRLTTVRLYVQYRMEPGPWSGSGTLYAMTTGGVEIASRPLLLTTTTLMDSWYLTADVRAYADANGLDTHDVVNDLRVKVMNSNTNGLYIYWTYSALEVSYNLSPSAPGVALPADSSTDVARMPDLQSGPFADRDSPQDAHLNTDWRIEDDSTSEVIAESSASGTNLATIVFTDLSLVGSLSTRTALLPNSTYTARARHRDEVLSCSDWSSSTFTTGWGQPPQKPTLTSPGEDTSRNPAVTTDAYSDPEGDTHLSTTWEVYGDDNDARGSRVALITSGIDLTSIVIDAGFENDLAGLLSLAPTSKYWLTARHTDEYGLDSAWGDDVSFTTGANAVPSQPHITSSGSATDHTPTITASAYADPDGDAHTLSDWRVFQDDMLSEQVVDLPGSAGLEAVDLDSGFMGDLAGASSLAPTTQYWAQVRYRDAYGGASPWSDPFAFTTSANDGPDQPVVTSPGTGISRNPLIGASAYADANSNAHASSVWEIYEQAGLTGQVVAYTDTVPADGLTTIAVDGSVTFVGSHENLSSLAPETEFWIRVRYVDEHGGESQWSDAVSFTTQLNQPPLQPDIVVPADGTIDVARNVAIACGGYTDADGDPHGSSDWIIYDQYPDPVSGRSPIAQSLGNESDTISIEADAGAFTFLGTHSGRANLEGGTEYWAVVIHYDVHGGASPASAPVSFTTNDVADDPDAPLIEYPGNGSSGIALSPTITTALYADPSGDAHASSDWEIYDDADVDNADPVAYSAGDPVNLTAIVVDADHLTLRGELLEYGSLRMLTTYYARVMFHDDMNNSSAWSPVAAFTTGNFAEGDDWPFFGGDCTAPPRSGPCTSPATAFIMILIVCALLRQHGAPV
jgi:hypothetical protein